MEPPPPTPPPHTAFSLLVPNCCIQENLISCLSSPFLIHIIKTTQKPGFGHCTCRPTVYMIFFFLHTNVFVMQVHRWVNYESMLKECLVGRMATKAAAPAKGKRWSYASWLILIYFWHAAADQINGAWSCDLRGHFLGNLIYSDL